ncbi:hypothetical protein E3J74_01475 [Candidatus Bathyarchaeota archaeon]|nr:MAG: hypothetical protein E3J74_01475 [Candidatus Bathyarchaeota archaeon]
MSEDKPKGYYIRMKEFLLIIASVITIIAGLLTIITDSYIPNPIAFEIAKYVLLIMIPITVSILIMVIVLRDINKKLKTTPRILKKFSEFDSSISSLRSAMSNINNDVKTFKKYFVNCPNCSNPMFLPILPSTVKWERTHEKDGPPVGFHGDPEYVIACPSCQKTWHIVYRK